jgi:adenine-specific DNA-methyltransferase
MVRGLQLLVIQDFFSVPRLLFREVPGTGKRIQATLAVETFYHGHSITPFKSFPGIDIDIKYLSGIVNSKLLSVYGGFVLPNFGKEIFPKLNPQDIKALSVRSINFSDRADVQFHDQIVALVERMLFLHQQLVTCNTPTDKALPQRQIDTADRQIDSLVYALYGLTDEEIRLIEVSQ